jgi:hypothetical protein
MGTLEEHDWLMFREIDKAASTTNIDDLDSWQKKYRGNSILREKNNHFRERKSIDLQQVSSFMESLKADLHPEQFELISRTQRAQTSNLVKPRKSIHQDSRNYQCLPVVRK